MSDTENTEQEETADASAQDPEATDEVGTDPEVADAAQGDGEDAPSDEVAPTTGEPGTARGPEELGDEPAPPNEPSLTDTVLSDTPTPPQNEVPGTSRPAQPDDPLERPTIVPEGVAPTNPAAFIETVAADPGRPEGGVWYDGGTLTYSEPAAVPDSPEGVKDKDEVQPRTFTSRDPVPPEE